METKTCRGCGVEKQIGDFSISDKAYGYRKARCKSCEAKRVRDYYENNQEYRSRAQSRARGEHVTPVRETPALGETDKTCSKCKRILPFEAFNRMRSGRSGRMPACRECVRSAADIAKAAGRWKSWIPENQRRAKLLSLYGITPEEYDAMLLAQNGCCALCGSNEHGHTRGKSMIVDHDHKTGKVRGLLCTSCNMWLGNYETLLERVGQDALDLYLLKTFTK